MLVGIYFPIKWIPGIRNSQLNKYSMQKLKVINLKCLSYIVQK